MIFKYCILILIWVLIILFLFIKAKVIFKKIRLPVFLLFSATLANALEVFIKGQITDYFDLSMIGVSWPIFNLADVLLTVGIIWISFVLLIYNKKI